MRPCSCSFARGLDQEHLLFGMREDAMPNRVKEALDSLEYIGFLSVTKVDATSDQRDNYGYRDKSILLIELKLETFGVDEDN